ncbi:MAG: hypothetical protein O7G31_13550, partial [Calditrichaeota bacterium]|nr:hypothetical protein [Calditrichota bacterium]
MPRYLSQFGSDLVRSSDFPSSTILQPTPDPTKSLQHLQWGYYPPFWPQPHLIGLPWKELHCIKPHTLNPTLPLRAAGSALDE